VLYLSHAPIDGKRRGTYYSNGAPVIFFKPHKSLGAFVRLVSKILGMTPSIGQPGGVAFAAFRYEFRLKRGVTSHDE